MAFTPLTADQYQKAISAGFTPDTILANEKIRKQNSDGAGTPAPAAPTTPALSQNPLEMIAQQSQSSNNNTLDQAEKVVGNIFPGRQVGSAIGTLAGYGITKANDLIHGTNYAQNYNLSAPSPLQVAGDVAKGAALVAGSAVKAPASILGNVVQGAKYGALFGAGQGAVNSSGKAIPTASDIGSVAKNTVTGGLLGGVISGATSAIGKLLEGAGTKIMNTAIKPSKADIEDGFSMDTVKKYNLGGSLSTMYDNTESKLSQLTTQLNDKLANKGGDIDNYVDLNDVYKDTLDSLGGNKYKSFGSNTSMSNALQQLKGEIINVGGDDGQLTVPQAQLVKQASGKFGAWQYGMQDPDSTARQTVYNAFYSKLKTAVEDASPDGVKGINKQIQELIPVQNAIIRRIPVADRNSALSLSDMVTLSASLLNPHALIGLGISLGQKEGALGNILAKLGPKVGALAPALGTLGSGAGALAPTPVQPTQ